MHYRSIIITERGTPEVLKIVENELREPTPGEVRIKILATGVGLTDVAMRYGYYPYAPKIPFVPGYEIVGMIDKIGAGTSRVAVGDRIGALTVSGGYAEYIYLSEGELFHVPSQLDPAEVVALILNYTTAYQMLYRTTKVKKGNKVLITGASGGVGSALLELGNLAKLEMYGLASRKKHEIVRSLGGQPIDYKTKDFVKVIRDAEPDGLDFVFDGVGGEYIGRGFKVLRKGGKLVEYGFPGFTAMLLGYAKLKMLDILPNRKSGEFYGITAQYIKDKQPFFDDISILLKLLEDGKLKPIIAEKFPILDAAKANALLESGNISGKIVLQSPELL
jgi:NADPH:quinone reductase-like Zn-dependent oxidoreductase